jgi:uncharacterized membrane protein YgcG
MRCQRKRAVFIPSSVGITKRCTTKRCKRTRTVFMLAYAHERGWHQAVQHHMVQARPSFLAHVRGQHQSSAHCFAHCFVLRAGRIAGLVSLWLALCPSYMEGSLSDTDSEMEILIMEILVRLRSASTSLNACALNKPSHSFSFWSTAPRGRRTSGPRDRSEKRKFTECLPKTPLALSPSLTHSLISFPHSLFLSPSFSPLCLSLSLSFSSSLPPSFSSDVMLRGKHGQRERERGGGRGGGGRGGGGGGR